MANKDLLEKLWLEILTVYGQTGRTRVQIPTHDVLAVLFSLAANIIAQIPEPQERRKVMMEIGPQLESIVNKVRARPDFHLAWRGPASLVLPT